jgi:hypothetical protein
MAPVKTGAILLLRHPSPKGDRDERGKGLRTVRQNNPGEKAGGATLYPALHECNEAIGSDFKTYVIAENTHGKSGSMKKNCGSWKVKRRLRAITPIDKEWTTAARDGSRLRFARR